MGRNFLIAAVLVPLVCFLLFKFQDGDFTLMIYEKIGQDPAVALRGKVVWITGASSGIGEYLAYELVKYGCKLVLSARRKAELERVKEKCTAIAITHDSSFKKDRDILVLPLDVQNFDTHEKLTQDVLKHFGKVDILVNNAGKSQRSLVNKTSLEVDRALLDLNVVGTISLTKAVISHMIERHEGQIVVVSSILGKIVFPYHATYCASKHALQGYFDTARLELAEHNIHVQTVLPGPVKSNIILYSFTGNINYSNEGSVNMATDTLLRNLIFAISTPSNILDFELKLCARQLDTNGTVRTHVSVAETDLELKDLPNFSTPSFRSMPTERCAKLMAVGMANNLDEVWISENPALLMVYTNQYLPNLYRWISKKFLMERFTKFFTDKKSSSETNK